MSFVLVSKLQTLRASNGEPTLRHLVNSAECINVIAAIAKETGIAVNNANLKRHAFAEHLDLSDAELEGRYGLRMASQVSCRAGGTCPVDLK